MSQRDGAPESCCSQWLLRLVSCMCCSCEQHNEWGTVWNGRDDYHHAKAPETVGIYGQRRVTTRNDPHAQKAVGVVVTVGCSKSARRPVVLDAPDSRAAAEQQQRLAPWTAQASSSPATASKSLCSTRAGTRTRQQRPSRERSVAKELVRKVDASHKKTKPNLAGPRTRRDKEHMDHPHGTRSSRTRSRSSAYHTIRRRRCYPRACGQRPNRPRSAAPTKRTGSALLRHVHHAGARHERRPVRRESAANRENWAA